jgi:hypothetical protein
MDMSLYLADLKGSIASQVKLLGLLRKRIEINNEKLGYRSLTEEEINELSISNIKTMGEIETLEKIIKEKENYFEEYAVYFEADLKEANANWEAIIQAAKLKVDKNPILKPYLEEAAKEANAVKTNYDKKVFVYKRLRSLLNGW